MIAPTFGGTLPRCYFCGAAYGACTCPELPAAEAIDTGDMLITEPGVSECGRFFVDPFVAYGEPFAEWLAARPAGCWPVAGCRLLIIPFAGPIDTAADVRAFYSAVEDAGVSYHPDTRFADVAEHATGRPTFDAIEAARLESLAERCHEVVADPYEISLAVWRERHPS